MKKLVFLIATLAIVGLMCGPALAQNFSTKRIMICHNDYDPCDETSANDNQGFVVIINASGWGLPDGDGHQGHSDKYYDVDENDCGVAPTDYPKAADCVIDANTNNVTPMCDKTDNPTTKKAGCQLNSLE